MAGSGKTKRKEPGIFPLVPSWGLWSQFPRQVSAARKYFLGNPNPSHEIFWQPKGFGKRGTKASPWDRTYSTSTSYQRQLRPRILASMVTSLPYTGPRSGCIKSYNDVQAEFIEEVTFSWKTIELLLGQNPTGDAGKPALIAIVWPSSNSILQSSALAV